MMRAAKAVFTETEIINYIRTEKTLLRRAYVGEYMQLQNFWTTKRNLFIERTIKMFPNHRIHDI